jgi:hypothetical protein
MRRFRETRSGHGHSGVVEHYSADFEAEDGDDTATIKAKMTAALMNEDHSVD